MNATKENPALTPGPPDLRDCLTAAEAADALQMTYHQLAARRQRKTGPAYVIWRGRIWYRRAALSEWKGKQTAVTEVSA